MSSKQPAPVPRFTVITLGVSDIRASIAFYKALGFERRFRATGEAVAWWRHPERAPVRFRSIPPRAERRRHLRKYAEGELGDSSFYFRGPEGKLNLRAQNLQIFLQMADGVDDETWIWHLRNGDY